MFLFSGNWMSKNEILEADIFIPKKYANLTHNSYQDILEKYTLGTFIGLNAPHQQHIWLCNTTVQISSLLTYTHNSVSGQCSYQRDTLLCSSQCTVVFVCYQIIACVTENSVAGVMLKSESLLCMLASPIKMVFYYHLNQALLCSKIRAAYSRVCPSQYSEPVLQHV